MRVLFSSTAGVGHVEPLLPLARAFAAAGHEVTFATAPSWRERLQGEGLHFRSSGPEAEESAARTAAQRAKLQALPPEERRPFAFTARFAITEAAQRLPDVRGAAVAAKPDVIVHESGDLAAPLVAAELDLPSVHHGFGWIVPRAAFERAAGVTDPLWRSSGIEPDGCGGVFRGFYVDVCPPSLAKEAPPAGTRVLRLRPASVDAAAEPPQWLAALPERPTVYLTLGTVFNDLERFKAAIGALAGLDCNVVVTIGRQNDPAALEPLPANAHIERYVPQGAILPRCDVVVSHGGSGSTLGALAHGLPMLLLPQGADQFDNAAACRAAGVALVLVPDETTPEAIRAAAVDLLGDPSYAGTARRVAHEIAGLPSPAELVETLEREL